MIGIIFLVIAAFVIYAIITEKKEQEETARKEAQEKALKESEKRKIEQQTAREIQVIESRVLGSDFYKELLSELKTQIHGDMRNYLTERYNEYMKESGAIQSEFQSFAEQNHFYTTLGDITVTPEGIYYNSDYSAYSWGQTITKDRLKWCKFQFNCSKHGYSNLNPIQQWALAEKLSRELGYKLTNYRPGNVNFRGVDENDYVCCNGTEKDAVDYLNFTKECANRFYRVEVYIDLLPSTGTNYLSQLMDSEVERLQSSGISYKSPF